MNIILLVLNYCPKEASVSSRQKSAALLDAQDWKVSSQSHRWFLSIQQPSKILWQHGLPVPQCHLPLQRVPPAAPPSCCIHRAWIPLRKKMAWHKVQDRMWSERRMASSPAKLAKPGCFFSRGTADLWGKARFFESGPCLPPEQEQFQKRLGSPGCSPVTGSLLAPNSNLGTSQNPAS